MRILVLLLITLLCCGACKEQYDHKGKTALVEVDGNFLYKEDLMSVLPVGLSKDDSILFAEHYIRSWAEEILLYEKAANNIPSFLGTPYVYGGASRSGTDCSGLTMQLFGYYGISLGHGCVSQYYASQPISRSELQPGDLVFFYEGIGHVGIYIGGGQFIHASDYGVVVASLYTSYWSACYYGAGRILAN